MVTVMVMMMVGDGGGPEGCNRPVFYLYELFILPVLHLHLLLFLPPSRD